MMYEVLSVVAKKKMKKPKLHVPVYVHPISLTLSLRYPKGNKIADGTNKTVRLVILVRASHVLATKQH